MNTPQRPHRLPADLAAAAPAPSESPEQLTLLPPRPEVSARFRLGKATCDRGLRHVAEIKAELARQRRERESATVHRLPPRRRAGPRPRDRAA